MTDEKILTKHPQGKSGKNIDIKKYDTLKQAILSALRKNDLTHTELFSRLNKSLKGEFSGNISWYGETVKLDFSDAVVGSLGCCHDEFTSISVDIFEALKRFFRLFFLLPNQA